MGWEFDQEIMGWEYDQEIWVWIQLGNDVLN